MLVAKMIGNSLKPGGPGRCFAGPARARPKIRDLRVSCRNDMGGRIREASEIAGGVAGAAARTIPVAEAILGVAVTSPTPGFRAVLGINGGNPVSIG